MLKGHVNWQQVGAAMKRITGVVCRKGYRFCYGTGIQTIRFFKYTGKRLHLIFAPVGHALYKAADFVLLRHLRAMWTECRRVGEGFKLAARRLKEAYEKKPLLVIPQALLLPFLAVRRHSKIFTSLFNLAAPVAAAFVLMGTVQYWSGLTFALSVEYDGENLGYIADESVFDAAVNLASDQVINTDNSFEVERIPKLTVAVVQKADMSDENEIAEKILLSSGDSIAEVSGLYIDGEFKGAVQSREKLEALLESIKSKYLTGAENERAEFVQDIEIVDKLYPVSAIVPMKKVESMLTAETVVARHYEVVKGDSLNKIASKNNMTLSELLALNPDADEMVHIGDQLLVQRPQSYLKVRVVRTLEYTESIPYETIKTKDDKQYTTYEKVTTQGEEGSRSIVAEVVLVDGEEQSRTILSSVVTKEPVNKEMIVGTKKKVSVSGVEISQGDGVTVGNFIWPLPVCTNVHQKYSRSHRAWDISSGPVAVYNQPILAADGGQVVYAGWSSGYGYLVRIKHSNGLETYYAHCKSLNVVVGQKVTQGQEIARAGNSGNSFGPHLHFEIRRGGVQLDPAKYLTPTSYR